MRIAIALALALCSLGGCQHRSVMVRDTIRISWLRQIISAITQNMRTGTMMAIARAIKCGASRRSAVEAIAAMSVRQIPIPNMRPRPIHMAESRNAVQKGAKDGRRCSA